MAHHHKKKVFSLSTTERRILTAIDFHSWVTLANLKQQFDYKELTQSTNNLTAQGLIETKQLNWDGYDDHLRYRRIFQRGDRVKRLDGEPFQEIGTAASVAIIIIKSESHCWLNITGKTARDRYKRLEREILCKKELLTLA